MAVKAERAKKEEKEKPSDLEVLKVETKVETKGESET